MSKNFPDFYFVLETLGYTAKGQEYWNNDYQFSFKFLEFVYIQK